MTAVHRGGIRRLPNNYLFFGSKNGVSRYLSELSNADELYESLNHLSERADDYYLSLQED